MEALTIAFALNCGRLRIHDAKVIYEVAIFLCTAFFLQAASRRWRPASTRAREARRPPAEVARRPRTRSAAAALRQPGATEGLSRQARRQPPGVRRRPPAGPRRPGGQARRRRPSSPATEGHASTAPSAPFLRPLAPDWISFACRWAQKKETLDLFSRAEMQRMAPFDTGEQCHPIWIP